MSSINVPTKLPFPITKGAPEGAPQNLRFTRVSEGASGVCSGLAFKTSVLWYAQRSKQGADVPPDAPAASTSAAFVERRNKASAC